MRLFFFSLEDVSASSSEDIPRHCRHNGDAEDDGCDNGEGFSLFRDESADKDMHGISQYDERCACTDGVEDNLFHGSNGVIGDGLRQAMFKLDYFVALTLLHEGLVSPMIKEH